MPLIVLLLIAILTPAAESCAHPRGVAVLVQPASARAIALAKAGWMVQALADDAGCQALRQAGAKEGVLGRSLWVGRWTGSIPLADQTADLIEGPAAAAVEARRVLIPGTGAAKAGSETIRVPRPSTWDGWSHWLHGPENNPVSVDADFRLPVRIAWLAKPFAAGSMSSARVAADGRLFLATGLEALNRDVPGSSELTAQSLHNGTQLWRRPLPKSAHPARSGMLALGSDLLLLEGGSVLRLDGATGTEKGRFAIAEGRELKWMGHAQGVLVLLAGPVDAPSQGYFADLKTKAKDIEEGRLDHGDELIAIDPATGAKRWSVKPPTPIDGRAVAIVAGRLLYFAPKSRVAALDVTTGKEIWVQADAEVLRLAGGERECDLTVNLEARPGLVCSDKIALLALPDAKHAVALAVADGKMLWQGDRKGGRSMHEVIVGDRIFAVSIEDGGILDAMTGKKVTYFNSGGCGVFTVVNNILLAQTGGPKWDIATGQTLPDMPLKTQCLLGGFVADGRAVYVPAGCRCHVVFGGIALVNSTGELPPAQDAKRLEAGRAGSDAPAMAAPGDWSTHRGDVRRSGSAPVAIAKLRQAWHAKPDKPFPMLARGDDPEWRTNPPVNLGDLTVVTAADGSIRAFNSGTGAARWTFWCDGPVLASATIAGGRVYAGSADGSIVCLSAADGALRWRFRAAPDEHRIPVYGALQSPWPVNSGVLVDGGVAYAVAGMQMSPPTTVYALDAVTGSMKWSKRGEWSPGGGLALIGGRLWASSFFRPGAAVRFALADGAEDPDRYSLGGMRGRDVAQVAPNLVLYGGSEVYRDMGNLGVARGEGLAMLSLDKDGRPRQPGIEALSASLLAPAGDGDLVVVAGTRFSAGPGSLDLEGWDPAKTAAESDALGAAYDLAKMPDWRLNQMPEARPEKHYQQPPQRRWGPLQLVVRGIALAKNAVVVLGSEREREMPKGPWRLLVLDRATGTTLQSFDLPGEPTPDGLALTRGGGVQVTLRDGGLVSFAP